MDALVGAEFGENASNCQRVGEESGCLTKRAVIVDGLVFARVEVGVPVGHVD